MGTLTAGSTREVEDQHTSPKLVDRTDRDTKPKGGRRTKVRTKVGELKRLENHSHRQNRNESRIKDNTKLVGMKVQVKKDETIKLRKVLM